MSVYRHLTLAEREYIMVQRAQGRSITAIAAALMRSKSTISRELKRNSDGNTYSASQAQARYQQRREACHRPHKLDDPVLHEQVKRLFLQQHWSPEQIQHRLRHEGSLHAISYATIHRGIYAGRFNDPDWVKSGKQRLRHRGKKRRSKGEPTNDNFPVGHELSERPAEAQARARIGDWEADTVAGVVGGAVLVTLTDRKSRFLRCARGEEDGGARECGDDCDVGRPGAAQHHARPGQGICAACGGGGGVGDKNIHSAAVPAVATRHEREHQRLVA